MQSVHMICPVSFFSLISFRMFSFTITHVQPYIEYDHTFGVFLFGFWFAFGNTNCCCLASYLVTEFLRLATVHSSLASAASLSGSHIWWLPNYRQNYSSADPATCFASYYQT